jgi:hypothetical protein
MFLFRLRRITNVMPTSCWSSKRLVMRRCMYSHQSAALSDRSRRGEESSRYVSAVPSSEPGHHLLGDGIRINFQPKLLPWNLKHTANSYKVWFRTSQLLEFRGVHFFVYLTETSKCYGPFVRTAELEQRICGIGTSKERREVSSDAEYRWERREC